MKKIYFSLAMLLTLQLGLAQQFTELNTETVQGIIYGQAMWIEVDNNAPTELLVSGFSGDYNNFSSLYSLETETPTEIPTSIEAYSHASMVKLDYNKDGFMDFIINGYDSNDTEKVTLYINDGVNNFTSQVLNISGTSTGKIASGDFNNDNLTDLIVTGVNDNYEYIADLYMQNINGEFTLTSAPFFGNSFGNILVFDANNDGNSDVLLTGFSNSYVPETKLYMNNGLAEFTLATNQTIANAYFSATDAGDYDNDGDLDVILSGFSSSYTPFTALYDNDGTGNFTENASNTFTQLYWGTTDFVDYDNDGDLDLFISGSNSDTEASAKFYNNNNGIYTENAEINNITGTYISSSDWNDYDNDGDLDFVLTGLTTDNKTETFIYTNQLDLLHTQSVSSPNNLVVYPNPVTDNYINIAFNTDAEDYNTEITISTVTGQTVLNTTIKSTSNSTVETLDLSNINSGIYILKITNNNRQVTKKLVVK
ncbi:FG-GAP-like repeat-containing protein [Bizionia sp. KMM 8389]